MIRRLLVLAVIGLSLGGMIGFVETWTSHRSDRQWYGHGEEYWSALLALPSLPGYLITWKAHGAYDWCIDEEWDYRVPITMWNGLFWSVIFVGIGALRASALLENCNNLNMGILLGRLAQTEFVAQLLLAPLIDFVEHGGHFDEIRQNDVRPFLTAMQGREKLYKSEFMNIHRADVGLLLALMKQFRKGDVQNIFISIPLR